MQGTRLGSVKLNGPVDIIALSIAVQHVREQFPASTVEYVLPYSDGSVRIEGKRYPSGVAYSCTAAANGYVNLV